MLNRQRIKDKTGKTGVIVSEVFRAKIRKTKDHVLFERTCVAVLWDDGTFSGAADLEMLTAIDDADGYVFCTDRDGRTIAHETILDDVSKETAEELVKLSIFKDQNPRIGKVIFPLD